MGGFDPAAAASRPLAYAVSGILYASLSAIAGLFLLGLWTLTQHHAAWANANLLLFNPLALAFIQPVWRSRLGATPSRVARGLIGLQLLAALVAVLLHVLPFPAQQNQPWLLFAIPVWCALAWSLTCH